jgi:hypothetical protein
MKLSQASQHLAVDVEAEEKMTKLDSQSRDEICESEQPSTGRFGSLI